jgi:tripartite-type tricarboxylate transporter receptor subunit TctC
MIARTVGVYPRQGAGVMATMVKFRGRGRWVRSGAIVIALSALLALPGATPAGAEYPDKPVRIIIPYGPGGVGDVSTRLVAQKLGERLGRQFFVDNRPGAGGIIAAQAAASSPPDGYTLFLMGNGAAVSTAMFKSLPYDVIRDFSSISLMAKFDMMLAVRGDSPIGTVEQLVAHARAHPGELNFGSISSGSTQHLSAELFRMLTGVTAAVVTYRSSPDLVTALIRGDVQVGFDYLAAFKPALPDNKLKIIATGGDGPSPQLPDVPTVKSSGYPGYSATSWNALSAPRGVAPDIIAKLSREMNTALKAPDIQERAAQLGIEAVGSTPDELTERVKADTAKWIEVVDKLGLPKQ